MTYANYRRESVTIGIYLFIGSYKVSNGTTRNSGVPE